mgnify:CR=1 FL=1
MYIFNLINDFNTLDVIILIVVIFIFIFLVFLTSSLMKKNKELREALSKNIKNDEEEIPLKKTNYFVKEDAFVKNDVVNNVANNIEGINNIDINSNRNIDTNTNEAVINKNNIDDEIIINNKEIDNKEVDNKLISDIKEEIKLEDNISTMNKNDIDEILNKIPVTESGPYKRNVLREINTRSQTSPVNIGNVTVEVPKIKVTSYVKKEEIPENNKNINTSEESNNISKSLDNPNNQNNITQNNTTQNNKDYLQEISEKIASELTPHTIELTDYEKQQEEEAIISYQELLKTKDNNEDNYENDDEEIDSFIDELKKFRTNLE